VTWSLVGYASGIAGASAEVGDGPLVMQHAPDVSSMTWVAMHQPRIEASLRPDQKISELCETLGRTVSALVRDHQRCCVIGGDHSSAIGTWSGVYDAMHEQGELGLLWLDAHMDSHTPETSVSGRIHGMPLASLLGYGYSTLTGILHHGPKLKPEHVCLIGVRSFEQGEAALLERLKVRVYLMQEVEQRGFETVLHEAIHHIKQHTVAYGISLDMDSIDPTEAPGVDVPEARGLSAQAVCDGLASMVSDPQWIAMEIAEFNPSKDQDGRTEKLIARLLHLINTR